MSALLSQVNTVSERNLVLEELDLLTKSVFNQKKDFNFALENQVRTHIAEAIKKDLTSSSISPADYLSQSQAALANLGAIKLTLAFDPSPSVLDRISSWARTNLSSDLIVDLEVDPSILGGVIIEYKGKYHDLSVKQKLDQYFKTNRVSLLERLKNQ